MTLEYNFNTSLTFRYRKGLYICNVIKNKETMTTQEIKQQYKNQALIYNTNLKTIRTQFNSKKINELKKEYNCIEDNHLAKVLMLRGIKL